MRAHLRRIEKEGCHFLEVRGNFQAEGRLCQHIAFEIDARRNFRDRDAVGAEFHDATLCHIGHVLALAYAAADALRLPVKAPSAQIPVSWGM